MHFLHHFVQCLGSAGFQLDFFIEIRVACQRDNRRGCVIRPQNILLVGEQQVVRIKPCQELFDIYIGLIRVLNRFVVMLGSIAKRGLLLAALMPLAVGADTGCKHHGNTQHKQNKSQVFFHHFKVSFLSQ